ncbi:MAG: hypothetical protein OYL92_02790 [Acidobacteriota bacterium]|nr:hypothetical protein [Acidobacteriota bacterium]MDE3263872.1 hypothetical protein [Acidobacteriota bacterium]
MLALLKLLTSHWLPPVLLSLLLIVAYGFFFLWDRELRGPRFEHAGDNLYYVGFLYTLVSLAVSLYRFTSDGYTEDIVQGFGVALSSTVFGLIGRVYVNQASTDEPARVEAAARQSLLVAHRELRAEMDYAIEDYKRFREDLGELREAVERAKGVTGEETKALANEAARLEDVRGLASRLDKAAEGAIGRMAERQDEMTVHMKDEAMATLRNIATQQEALSDGMLKAQSDALDRVAARLDDASSSLDGSAASMARTIRNSEQEIEAEASALRSAMDRSLESFRTTDFEREVAARVLEPAEARLRQLMDRFQPLVESLGSTQAGQERAVGESGRILQQLSRALAQSEDLAGRYQAASDSLARAASTLDSLPEQLERQSLRSEAVARETAAAGERLRQISGALESASSSLAAVAESSSRRRRGIFASFRRA